MKESNNISIISALHGDEILGEIIYDYITANHPEYAKYLHLIIGNKEARSKAVRYIEEDLNRIFAEPQNSSVDFIEVDRIKKEIKNNQSDFILDIHTTRRSTGSFIITDELSPAKITIINSFPNLNTCCISHKIIDNSLVKYYPNCISIEVSQDEINQTKINEITEGIFKLIGNGPQVNTSDVFEVKELISKTEYIQLQEAGVSNWEEYQSKYPIMLPKNSSEMASNYYGFWGIKAA